MVTVSRGTRTVAEVPVVAGTGQQHLGYATLTPLTDPAAAVVLEMSSPVARSGGQATYDEISRPKRQNALGYTGISLYEQTFTVLFEGRTYDQAEPTSVQPQVDAMLALTRPLPGRAEPPVLNLDGPVWGRRGAQQWVLRAAEEVGEARRRDAEGYLWQVEYRLTLTQYVPVDVLAQVLAPVASPAQAAQAAASSSTTAAAGTSGRTYVVAKGDTLSRIAQRQLGNASRWREIATLNKLSNPNSLRVGQKLQLP